MPRCLLLGLGLASCVGASDSADTGPDEPPAPAGCLEVEPGPLNFGEHQVPAPGKAAQVQVSNGCEGMLQLSRPSLRDGEHFHLTDPKGAALAEGESLSIEVLFEPAELGLARDQLTLFAPGASPPEVTLALRGTAVGGKLIFWPKERDFESPYIGCSAAAWFRLRNDGTAPLQVHGIEVAGHGTAFLPSLAPTADERIVLAPGGGEVILDVAFSPTQAGSADSTLYIHSDDAFLPTDLAALLGVGVAYGEHLERFEVKSSEADVFFHVDRSTPIMERSDVTAVEMAELFGAMPDVDVRLAALTADEGCAVGPEAYIDSSFTASEAAEAFHVMVDQQANLAPYGANDERGFEVFHSALMDELGKSGCNVDLYRPDAMLAMVGVTDEEEQSGRSWDYYVGAFQALKDDPQDVVFHAIAGDSPDGCAGADYSSRWHEATLATGGEFVSVCAVEWSGHFRDIGKSSVPRTQRYALSFRPIESTLAVTVDGITSTDWAFDPVRLRVEFDANHLPDTGSWVELSYIEAPDCEQ